MKLIHSGSVKDAYEVSKDEIEFQFTDKISVFDKPLSSFIPHKGETLCKTAVHWFQIAEKIQLPTHYLGKISSDRIRVKKVDIIYDYDAITPTTTNYLIPCEFIMRYYAAGSLYDRIKSGKFDPRKAGFKDASEVEYGVPLPEPYFEMSTKLERVDRLITTEEALSISKMTPSDLEKVKKIILKIDKEINETAAKNGLIHVDGKKEFAMDKNRNLMLIDVFGTADEDRFWDASLVEKGEFKELSKEFVRQYYQDSGYKETLYAAREAGEPEPPIPPLPDDFIKQTSDLYINLYKRITGTSTLEI